MPNYSRSNYSKKALLTLKNIGKTLKISILGLHYTYVAANKKQIFPTRFLCFLSPTPFFQPGISYSQILHPYRLSVFADDKYHRLLLFLFLIFY